jgi:hypothetical protein
MKITPTYIIAALLFSSCTSPNNPKVEPESYLGNWRLESVGTLAADSIQKRQTLTLMTDSNYICTFTLIAAYSHDTIGLVKPYKGKWSIQQYSGNYGLNNGLLILFYPDSGDYILSYPITGGRQSKEMFFSGEEDFTHYLSWNLIE